MRSGHVSRGRPWLAFALFCAQFLGTGLCVRSVHAQPAVVVASIDDAELLSRIRGQTRDLPITLIQTASPSVSRPSATQLQNIANEHTAEFVVSVEQEPNGARVVYVLDARAGELRVRAAPAPQRRNRFARSAAAETVALIVRGELADALAARASQKQAPPSIENSASPNTTQSGRSAPGHAAQSETVNDQPAQFETTSKPEPKPRAKQPEPPKPKEEPNEPDEPEPEPESQWQGPPSTWFIPTQVSLELAGRISTPITDRYFLGAALSLRCTFEYISIGVTGASSLANRANIEGLTLRLREHAIGFDAFAHLRLPANFNAGLGAAGRWLFYQRNASSGDADWRPEPADTSTTFAVGPQLELRWQLSEHLGVGVRIGLDVLLRPVSWRYRPDTNMRVPVELEHQNRTAPWLSLGVFGSL